MAKSSISIITIILLSLSVTGCLGHQRAWKKPGVTQYNLENASSECKYQIELNRVPANARRNVYANCMQSKGFRYN